LLLSRDSAYRVRVSVTVAPITRTVRGIPVEVPLSSAEGLSTDCAVNLDDVMTIPKALLQRQIATLSDERMAEVVSALTFALDLDR